MLLEIIPERPFFLRRGSWIGNASTVEIETQWGGRASLFGGQGAFGYCASGQGTAVATIYGAADVMELAGGEVVTIDTGHVVAYDLAIQFSMRRAVAGKTLQSMKSGEGWVFDFTGPGRVLLQSRNPDAFAEWAASVMPGTSPREGIGGSAGLGDLFGR